ncbi:hypothetical protein R0135_00585 [Congregibacter variabilis]|uniref:Uncharacterized protein n=1 Tax=Congregibacter variabilis TaxID=3081200 RepID=A0ABZ0I3C3_9GAMM|nr:hypothetical protein R0135_00585 [Congregibacter sp. IMCC43200]
MDTITEQYGKVKEVVRHCVFSPDRAAFLTECQANLSDPVVNSNPNIDGHGDHSALFLELTAPHRAKAIELIQAAKV